MRLLGVLLLICGLALAETSPLNEVKKTLNEVLRVVAEKPGDANKDLRRKELRQVLEPRFDFEEMAKRSLGANWKERTEAEQKDFVSVFSELLARTYVARIENVKPGMVQFENESVELPRAIVKTTVKSEGSTFPIDYRLILKDNQWKVYDVVIENIGLVANYRNEFSGIIRREEFSGLMKSLREKVEKK
jgi:phospholipid transport system substrate-binding protein